MKLEAEVTGGGEGAEFALERLTAVLVLMYLEKGDGFNVTLWLLTTPSFSFFVLFQFDFLQSSVPHAHKTNFWELLLC